MAGLLSVDYEAFALLLNQLPSPDCLARLALTCKQLHQQICIGPTSSSLWRNHVQKLLGPLIEQAASHNLLQQAQAASPRADGWYKLYCAARVVNEVHWSQCFQTGNQLDGISCQHWRAPAAADEEQLLARCCHTATAVDSFIVLLGGVLRDGSSPLLDVSVVDVVHGRVIQPQLLGEQRPPALSHMCTALVSLSQGSVLHDKVLAAVQQQWQSRPALTEQQQQAGPTNLCSTGHTFVIFGGLTPDGRDQGATQLYVLWLAADAGWGTWLLVDTTGPAPAHRAFACCEALSGGTKVLVYGGWTNGSLSGTAAADVSEHDGALLLCVYLLDANSLTWVRQPTRAVNEPPRVGQVMPGPSPCPGPRKQALSCCRVSPVTGQQEFVVLGGHGSDGMSDLVPHALDTATFLWTRGPDLGYLPLPRVGAALMQLSPEWLLLLGGTSPTGSVMNDVERLHLPTLSWHHPPRVVPSGSSAAWQVAHSTMDCTATAGVVVGGTRRGATGDIIVPRASLLLPGAPIMQHDGSVDTQGWTTVGSKASSLPRKFTESHVKANHPVQAGTGLTNSLCRCGGSCCSCVTAALAAARVLQQQGPAAGGGCARSIAGRTAGLSHPSIPAADPLATQLPLAALVAPSVMSRQPQKRLPGPAQADRQEVEADCDSGSVYPAATPGLFHAKGAAQSMKGWSSEIDTRPVHVDNVSWRTASPAAEGARLSSGATGAVPAPFPGWPGLSNAAGGVPTQEWRVPQPCRPGQEWLQLLLTVAVVCLALVLAYPSLMMHAV